MRKTLTHAIKEKNIRKIIRCVKSIFPVSVMGNLVFLKYHHRLISYKNPMLLDEKLLILRGGLYKNNDLVNKCADKVAVRQYVRKSGPNMDRYLVELLGVYFKAEDIDWDELPDKFVAKCSHGSGYNIVVRDKSEMSRQYVYDKLDYWLEENYGIISSELQYKKIPPQIIIEKFIEGENGDLPVDYKFFASRGDVICCLLVTGRKSKEERLYVDDNFCNLNFVSEYTGNDYHTLKPDSYEEMIELARILSREFPFVRVDLYEADGKVFFGELTFTPHGCNHDYLSDEAQLWIGQRIRM